MIYVYDICIDVVVLISIYCPFGHSNNNYDMEHVLAISGPSLLLCSAACHVLWSWQRKKDPSEMHACKAFQIIPFKLSDPERRKLILPVTMYTASTCM